MGRVRPGWDEAMSTEALVSSAEAARLIGIKPQTLANWRQANKGPRPVRISSNRVKYDPADIQAWIDSKKGGSENDG